MLTITIAKKVCFEVQYKYDGTYALRFLTVITGARSGPGDGWSWGQPTANLEQAYIDAEIQNVYVGLSLKPVVQKLPERITDKFVENNTKNRQL